MSGQVSAVPPVAVWPIPGSSRDRGVRRAVRPVRDSLAALGRAAPNDGDGSVKGVPPVVVVPVGDFLEHTGIEPPSEGGAAHHGETDLAVLLSSEFDFGEMVGQEGLVGDGVNPVDLGEVEGVGAVGKDRSAEPGPASRPLSRTLPGPITEGGDLRLCSLRGFERKVR